MQTPMHSLIRKLLFKHHDQIYIETQHSTILRFASYLSIIISH